jgi:hypothetical protein
VTVLVCDFTMRGRDTRDVETTWLVKMDAMQQKDSSLEAELEMDSWNKEMRIGKSTINGGKPRTGTSKAIVERNSR